MKIQFLFFGEGSSDTALVPILEELCLAMGAEEALGIAPNLKSLGINENGKSLTDRLNAVLKIDHQADFVFYHWDADNRDAAPRYLKLSKDLTAWHGPDVRLVPVIPIQETEAWALLDEAAIRRVAENPKGRMALKLPPPKRIEQIADPKTLLKDILTSASGIKGGRRLAKFKDRFPRHRRQLLEGIDINGPITQLSAWQRLSADLKQMLAELAPRSE